MSAGEVRCYGHVFDPHHQANGHQASALDGWPAHAWEISDHGKCQHCPNPVVRDDRYVCVANGVMHVRCVEELDGNLLAGPTLRREP